MRHDDPLLHRHGADVAVVAVPPVAVGRLGLAEPVRRERHLLRLVGRGEVCVVRGRRRRHDPGFPRPLVAAEPPAVRNRGEEVRALPDVVQVQRVTCRMALVVERVRRVCLDREHPAPCKLGDGVAVGRKRRHRDLRHGGPQAVVTQRGGGTRQAVHDGGAGVLRVRHDAALPPRMGDGLGPAAVHPDVGAGRRAVVVEEPALQRAQLEVRFAVVRAGRAVT
mmetsp:Transcript_37598/g.116144  ORF Transcript_37598/g.116144 Transcript_37598/m.116144 type:complete len:222 (+) Transcript_37598:2601-3266(+)